MNAVHKSLETVFSIAICRKSGDKRKSINLFLTILDLRSSIVFTFSIAAYLKCLFNIGLLNTQPNQSKTMPTRNNLLSGHKRQSKTLFLMILDLRSSIVFTFSIAAYLKCLFNICLLNTQPNQSKTMATRNDLLSGYKRQSKTLFLTILDLSLSIV